MCLLTIEILSLHLEGTNTSDFSQSRNTTCINKQNFKKVQLPAKFSFSSSESNCFFFICKFCKAVSNNSRGTAEHSTAF